MANEDLSNKLTLWGEKLEKALHIHQTRGRVRAEDIDTKVGMLICLAIWFLFLAPITPIGRLLFSWAQEDMQLLIMLMPIPVVALLFANLHPEVDYGDFYDEDSCDDVKEGNA